MSAPEQGAQECGAHPRISAELRAMAELFAARLQPWLERMARDGVPGQDPGPGEEQGDSPCTRCPLCALLAAVRGDRPDVVGRLAEHAAGLATAVRDLVTPPAEPGGENGHAAHDRSGRVSVQHIVVHAPARDEGGAPGC
ncbi:MAG TPA: hypothetical protein VGJ13_01205 [Pseudonocardiaceae bacterium]|jgi:hypothetical protein